MKEYKKLILRLVVVIIAVVVGSFSFFWIVNFAEKRSVVVNCTKLEAQMNKGYVNFFVTQWQKDMCDSYDFTFAGSKDAPVHVNSMPNGGDGYLERGVWYTNGLGKWKLEVN